MQPKRILVLGGGFGGIRAALSLAQKNISDTTITLISDRHHFEYTPALYKLATGRSPRETAIPLAHIFEKTKIQYIVDTVTGGSLPDKVIQGASGSVYQYDFLILALGAEVSYFDIKGVEENSYNLKTAAASLKLNSHIHKLFNNHHALSKGELMSQFQFVIVGGGPAGVELAGEIRQYALLLAKSHGIPRNLITVNILQNNPRLLANMSEKASSLALSRMNKLGVNIITGKSVTEEDVRGVYLKDIKFNARTIVWTAGVKNNHIYKSIKGLEFDKSGKVIVDSLMRAGNTENVFVIGDSASTPFAGTAQTAIYDGQYIPRLIRAIILKKKKLPIYKPRTTPYVVPIGRKWAVINYKNKALGGMIFWWMREFIDLKFFFSILSPRRAWRAWYTGTKLCESCPTCHKAERECVE